MARQVEGPWYRGSKGTWYATLSGGRKVSLGIRGESNRVEAVAAWHRLMAGGETTTHPPVVKAANPAKAAKAQPDAATVKAVADAFLSDVRGRVRKNTHGVYGYLLGKVTNAYGEQPATSLTGKHFLPWVHALPVSRSTRADVARVTATAFRWAEAEGLIPANPLKGMRRPTGESRGAKAVVTADTHAALLAVAHPTFDTLLTLLWETGARPSELSRLTAANVDLANGVAVLMDHKTAEATGRPRLIALTPNAVAVLKTLAEARPQGPLLRTRRGEPWTKDRIVRVMSRACKAAKVKATAYGYRHGYATQALIRGLPDATVAALLGHSSTTMLHKHYSHLTAQARAMREAAAKVWG